MIETRTVAKEQNHAPETVRHQIKNLHNNIQILWHTNDFMRKLQVNGMVVQYNW